MKNSVLRHEAGFHGTTWNADDSAGRTAGKAKRRLMRGKLK
jgi:hypothetical protein